MEKDGGRERMETTDFFFLIYLFKIFIYLAAQET